MNYVVTATYMRTTYATFFMIVARAPVNVLWRVFVSVRTVRVLLSLTLVVLLYSDYFQMGWIAANTSVACVIQK